MRGGIGSKQGCAYGARAPLISGRIITLSTVRRLGVSANLITVTFAAKEGKTSQEKTRKGREKRNLDKARVSKLKHKKYQEEKDDQS